MQRVQSIYKYIGSMTALCPVLVKKKDLDTQMYQLGL